MDEWAIAVSRPSRVAPRRTRWIVAGRCVELFIVSGRCIAILTGRPAALAPSAAQTASARTNSLPPKPPPTNGESSRIFSGATDRIFASDRLLHAIIWLEVHSVSLSPCHDPMVANGSIIAWLSSGVV